MKFSFLSTTIIDMKFYPNRLSKALIPFLEDAILNGKHGLIVRSLLTVSPSLAKEIKDRLSKDHIRR